MAHGRFFILPILSSTVSPHHEASRDHVVQRLLFLGEPRHEVSDQCGHQVGDDLAKVPSRGAPEAHPLSRHIRHHQTQHPFPDRSLPLGTLQQRVVQPCQKQAYRGSKKYECDEHEDANIIQVLVRMDLAEESAQPRQQDKRNQYQHEPHTQHDIVNEERQKTQPESGVLHARYGSVSGIRGNGCRAASARGGHRSTHDRRRRPRGGKRERVSAIRATRRSFRQRSATLGTIQSGSSFLSDPSRSTRQNGTKSYFQPTAWSMAPVVQRCGGKKFIALVPHHYCYPIACYSAHLSDFTCIYRKRRFSCSVGSFLASLKGSGQKSKGRKFNAIPDFAPPSHPVCGLFHHGRLVHAAPRPLCGS